MLAGELSPVLRQSGQEGGHLTISTFGPLLCLSPPSPTYPLALILFSPDAPCCGKQLLHPPRTATLCVCVYAVCIEERDSTVVPLALIEQRVDTVRGGEGRVHLTGLLARSRLWEPFHHTPPPLAGCENGGSCSLSLCTGCSDAPFVDRSLALFDHICP